MRTVYSNHSAICDNMSSVFVPWTQLKIPSQGTVGADMMLLYTDSNNVWLFTGMQKLRK